MEELKNFEIVGESLCDALIKVKIKNMPKYKYAIIRKNLFVKREDKQVNYGFAALASLHENTIIEYVTDDNLLTKVIFKYRKGHELVTNEFYCAPQGPAGKDGRDGRVGATGPKGEKGDKGDTPSLNKVILTWVDSHIEEGGRFVEDCLH